MHNCSLVLSKVEVEEYLFRATVFKVRPGGLTQQMSWPNDALVSRWSVAWQPASSTVQTLLFESSAARVVDCNYGSRAVVAAPLPAPEPPPPPRGAAASRAHRLAHVDATGVLDVGSLPGAGPAAAKSEVLLVTTNLTLNGSAPAAASSQLLARLRRLAADPTATLTLIGIVSPPVTLDLGYSVGLLALRPDAASQQLSIVNMAMSHLAQSPTADRPDASLHTPGVWTQLLWSVQRCA